MNKIIFLQKLKNALTHMSEQEKEDILRDYEEHFFAAGESGKTEDEVTAKLGDPILLAKSYSSEKIIKKIESSSSVQKKIIPVAQSYFLVAGLGFFNVIVFGIPYFIAFIITLSIWIASIMVTVINFFEFIGSATTCLFHCNVYKASSIFSSLGGVFLGVILLYIAYFITNFLLKLFVKHVQLSLQIAGIKGENKS